MGAEADKVEIRTFDAYFDRGDGEVDLGKILLVGCTFEKELYDIMKGKTNRRIDIKEWVKDVVAELGMSDFTWQNLQEELGITATNVSAGTQTVSNEEGTFPSSTRKWTSLKHGQGSESPISDVSVALVQTTTTPTTSSLTGNSDYVTDYDGARIYACSGSGYESDDFIINYKYTTVEAKKFKIGTAQVNTVGALRLSKTLQNGKTLEVKLYKAFVAADVAHEFAPDSLSEHTVTFRAIEDPSQSGEELAYVKITV